jgi:predicted O-methyltransferase YrrM
MTTLESKPLAPLLDRLFKDADAVDWSVFSDDEQAVLRGDRSDYRRFYGMLKDFPLPVSRQAGALLYMLARGGGARSIVEFGLSFGISTLHLAAALRDNGGGRLITTEFEPSKVARARANLQAGGLLDLVEIREGDALQTLSRDLPETIDLVLLDGAKNLYPDVLALLEVRLRPGAFVVADNADDSPAYLEHVRRAGGGYISVPFAADVELSLRV